MIQAVSDIVQGRTPVPPVPSEVSEFFMMKEFPGMTPPVMRAMSQRDFRIFSTLASTANRIQNQMQEREMRKASAARSNKGRV